MRSKDMRFEKLKQLESERLFTGLHKLKKAIKSLEEKPAHLLSPAERENLRHWRSALRNAELATQTKQNRHF